ncbi:uncharacterized protein LOC141674243 [Apium graveolens]|uniref:uncharacterized protein LOC141674243 n=1 Tax=Apium graveolens TaxID=4045 RepID=UPI003D7A8B5F
MLNDWKRAQQRLPNYTQSQQQNNSKFWSKPPPGWIKINVDAACVPGAGCVGLGCVVRNESGAFVKAISNVLMINMQAREAETLWPSSKRIFESDSKTLVEAVNGNGGASMFDTIAEYCSDLLKHFDEVLVNFVH